ncbi:hypothetical protein EVAR_29575_1 [Eumeta japonica]|uniref:Uncharacterized protein n=1 Tax=Eumeta variegata TaxID=151549 RepID=A0A4C1VVT8_EUMVA|nr:hypothetical protein EVAR_29575_1 [Eumeta japonica]
MLWIKNGCANVKYLLYKDSQLILELSAYRGQGCVLWLFNLFIDSCLNDLKEYECTLKMDELSVKYALRIDRVTFAPLACELRSATRDSHSDLPTRSVLHTNPSISVHRSEFERRHIKSAAMGLSNANTGANNTWPTNFVVH